MRFANNMCPSQGTMDIFVEPVLPRPQVVICGSSPVAVAVADLAKRSGLCGHRVRACGRAGARSRDADRRIEGYALPVEDAGARYVVVSTQGRGDEAALLAALAIDADYVAFVGSRKKAEALKATLAQRGVTAERLAKLKAPAGLDLGAITPGRDRDLDLGGDRRSAAQQAFAQWRVGPRMNEIRRATDDRTRACRRLRPRRACA